MPDTVRFVDICASDLDTLVEVKPEGKVGRRLSYFSRVECAYARCQDEMVISLNVSATNIKETSPEASHDIIISRPLSIVS